MEAIMSYKEFVQSKAFRRLASIYCFRTFEYSKQYEEYMKNPEKYWRFYNE